MDSKKLLLGLIGSGIQASLTPAMHEREAAEHGVRCFYQLLDLDSPARSEATLPGLLAAAELMGFSGLNITHPCKESVAPLLDELSDDARALGAVNTIVLHDGRRSGHNTDWRAFEEGFRHGLPDAGIERVAQLGAGGAGAATAYAMLKMGARHLTVFDCDRERAARLVERFGALFGQDRVSAGSDAADCVSAADGLIHATPTGMSGHPGIALPPTLLRRDLWVAEVVYFPLETDLLRAARASGCATVDGSGMAIHQAVEAFRLFTGLEPDAERMRRHFLEMAGAQ